MVHLKYVPELKFEADLSFDYADRIQRTLDQLGLPDAAAMGGSEKDEEHGP
jgi:ribosome-binding factor A